LITVVNVSKQFGKIRALGAVSLTFREGERVAIVGTNGSGKTTLLRAICGLLRVDGVIQVFGVDVAKAPEVALEHLAYVPQVAPPLDAPVAELVRAFCTLRKKKDAEVASRAARLGLSLAAVGSSRVRDLSGGMKQKLLAAFALSSEVPVLVCDEPTANLDSNARAAFFEEVDARPKNSILILCSHRVEEVRHFVDRVIEMKDGQVVRDVPVAEALEAEIEPSSASGSRRPADDSVGCKAVVSAGAVRDPRLSGARETHAARDVGTEQSGRPAADEQRRAAPPKGSEATRGLAASSIGRLALLALTILVGLACRASPLTAEEPIWGKQPCAHCSMLVTEKQPAAQAVAADGSRQFFDDIGCLVSWFGEQPAAPKSMWVRDASNLGWVGAREAKYSDGHQTPMDFGYWAAATGDDFDTMRKKALERQAAKKRELVP
jgi:ABC-2 type transport system ATP-binding protein